MKRLLLLMVCTVIMSACITKEYDLGKNIGASGIGIGDPASEFVMPLVDIHIGSNELLADEGNITELFGNVEAWIPKSYNSIEVKRLGDSLYVNQWVADLCMGMNDDNEFARVVEHIHKNRREDFSDYITPIDDSVAYKERFKDLWNANRSRIERKIGEVVASDIAAIDTEVAPIEYEIQNNLDENVIYMLINGQNDDAFELFGTIHNKMEPIECTFKAEFVDTSVGFDVSLPAAVAIDTGKADNAVAIPNVKVPAKDARAIIDHGSLRIMVTLVKYYPRTTYREGEQVLALLKLRRKGGLNVNL